MRRKPMKGRIRRVKSGTKLWRALSFQPFPNLDSCPGDSRRIINTAQARQGRGFQDEPLINSIKPQQIHPTLTPAGTSHFVKLRTIVSKTWTQAFCLHSISLHSNAAIFTVSKISRKLTPQTIHSNPISTTIFRYIAQTCLPKR